MTKKSTTGARYKEGRVMHGHRQTHLEPKHICINILEIIQFRWSCKANRPVELLLDYFKVWAAASS